MCQSYCSQSIDERVKNVHFAKEHIVHHQNRLRFDPVVSIVLANNDTRFQWPKETIGDELSKIVFLWYPHLQQ